MPSMQFLATPRSLNRGGVRVSLDAAKEERPFFPLDALNLAEIQVQVLCDNAVIISHEHILCLVTSNVLRTILRW